MVNVGDVAEALSKCRDPELDADIVSIGLIYGISLDSSNVRVTMTMTSPMCPVTGIILADVQLRLEQIPNVGKIDVDLVWDPAWNPEMMSDDLKYRN